MQLVYLDESARNDEFYFFGALITDAEAVRSIDRSIDDIVGLAARHVDGLAPSAEIHAVDVFHGRGAWHGVPIAWRVKACDLVAKVLARSSASFVFRGIHLPSLRARYRHPHPAHRLALGHTLAEVHRQLATLDDDGFGLVLADEHHMADHARRDLRNFKASAAPGFTSRPLHCIADTIYFGPSRESRLLQAAGVATYFLNRHRTIRENDPRAKRALDKIVGNIRSITVSEYVWFPQKHNAPR